VINWAQNNEELRIVDDQIGNPTWARMLATLSSTLVKNSKNETMDLFETKGGLYHLAGGGYTSRYEWTRSIINFLPKDIPLKVKKIIPIKTDAFPKPAIRPLFTALNCEKFEHIFSIKIIGWKTALKLSLT